MNNHARIVPLFVLLAISAQADMNSNATKATPDNSGSGAPAAPKDAGPAPETLLLKLSDSDPTVRAQTVTLAGTVSKQDYRVIDALARVMDNPSEDALVRLDAACIVGSQDSPYALDGARRAAELIDQLGYPGDRVTKAQAAVGRQGDAIISDLERANTSGRLSNAFFLRAMNTIGTDAARVAASRLGGDSQTTQSGANRYESRKTGIDRHTVNR